MPETTPTLQSMTEAEARKFYEERFQILYENGKAFCVAVGLPETLIADIVKSDTDWAFTLKIDALLETAAKHFIRHGLRFRYLNHTIQNKELEDFVDSLPMNGRTSILKLLDACGIPDEERGFIEMTRVVRNAFAHNIHYAGLRLIDLIKTRSDRSRVLKYLSAIATFDEAHLITSYEKDPSFLRFCMLDSLLRFLFYAYHLSISSPKQRAAP